MNEPPAASAPGNMLVDAHFLVPLGSITWETICLPAVRDSASRGIPSTLGEDSGLSGIMESTETIEGVFERLGETMYSSLLQETMRVAMIEADEIGEGVFRALCP